MSSTELVGRYLAERARLNVFAPLALLVACAGAFTAHGVASANAFGVATVQALLLIVAFRVWDDLEDRDRDAREHPERVMVRAGRVSPFVGLACALALGGLVPTMLSPQPGRLGAVVAGAAVLFVWYRVRPKPATGVVGGHIVLLKYPAIALSVAPSVPSPAVLASLYLVLCVYECFDDPSLRASIVARRIAFAELALVPLIISAAYLGGTLP